MTPHGHHGINSVASGNFANKIDIRIVVIVRPSGYINNFICHSDVFCVSAHVFRCRHDDELNLKDIGLSSGIQQLAQL
jgi:hypothetical protein